MENSRGTIVFYCMEAIGHINPILSIAAELQKRGFRVVLLTTRPMNFATKLKALGFEVDHCREADVQLDKSSAVKDMLKPLFEQFRQGARKSFAATYKLEGACGKYLKDVKANHDHIEAKLKSLKPDLIVVDHVVGVPCTTYLARRWARVYSGFPSALYSNYNDNFIAGFGPRLEEMTPEEKSFEIGVKKNLRAALRQFWQEKGLADWPGELEIAPTSPYLNFYFGPQDIGLEKIPSLKPLPNQWFRLEHTIDETEDMKEFEIPEKLADKPGKLIYFSLGTLVNSDTELVNKLLEIFSKSPNRFIVSTGQLHDEIKLYDNMWGESFVDQKALLKKIDLFITHGGHNSIIEAFYNGVPGLIVLPVFADQFDSARRLEDCGFGIGLNPFDCKEKELLEAIDKLLSNDDLRQKMKSIGERLRSIKYHEIAADKLTDLVKESVAV